MPATGFSRLVRAVTDGLEEAGYAWVLISSARRQPRELALTAPDGARMVIWAYVWTLTHGGGRKRPEHEYRIQMTSVPSPLELNPSGGTALLGYEPGRKVFAGFDVMRHREFTGRSPSVQIDVRTVESAIENGLAFDRKGNVEIAVAIRPDYLGLYLQNAGALHAFGARGLTFKLLEEATSRREVAEEELTRLRGERRRIVQTISRLSRDADFRRRVLGAYGQRCAVTGAQLRLVDAAHILPVGAPGSLDEVHNGIALSPTYHRAFDQGLIYLGGDYRMRLNSEKASYLARARLDQGIAGLRKSLGRIQLPKDRREWPDPEFIDLANGYRGIP